jgi:hypothetical protein
MAYNFHVNINSVADFAEDIKKSALNLEDILDYLFASSRDIDSFFDTPSANTMQDALLRYIQEAKKSCQRLNDLSNKVALFNSNYRNMYDTTSQSVGGNSEL